MIPGQKEPSSRPASTRMLLFILWLAGAAEHGYSPGTLRRLHFSLEDSILLSIPFSVIQLLGDSFIFSNT